MPVASTDADIVVKAILDEGPISVQQAASLLPGPEKISTRTVYRWIRSGVRVGPWRVRIEHIKLGGRIYTSEAAIQRFVSTINDLRAAQLKHQHAS